MTHARKAVMWMSFVFAWPAAGMPQLPAQALAGAPTPSQAPESDNHPLSGIRQQGLGATRPGHSFVQPSASVFGIWDSNGNFQYGSQAATSFLGQLSFVRFMGRGGSLEYAGTVRYDTRRMEYEDQLSSSHLFRASQQFTGRSWSFFVSDEAQLTPSTMGAGVGLGMLGGFSAEELGIPVLDPLRSPDQSLVTESSQRFINTAAAEIGYRVSGRTSLTLTGSDGRFRSLDENLLDSTEFSVDVGYNFALTPHDTIALMAGYEVDDIPQMDVQIRAYSPGMRYARRETAHFLLEVSGYAQPYRLTSHGTQRDEFSWGGDAGVQYRFSKSSVRADLRRGISLGSGVLAGAIVQSASATLSFPLSRRWDFDLNGVYARNSGLSQQAVYDTEYASVALTRQMTRTGRLFLRYGVQNGLGNCTRQGCGSTMLQNVLNLGINWSGSPIGIF